MEERIYSIYKHTTPSGKVYIGQTMQDPEFRWRNGTGYSYNSYFNNSIKKHGWDNIKSEVIIRAKGYQRAKEIRARYTVGDITHRQLADLYDISSSQVSRILIGEQWN